MAELRTDRSGVADALNRIETGSLGMWPVRQYEDEVLRAVSRGNTLLVTQEGTGVIMCNWEPHDDCWYVVHAFGSDVTILPMVRELKRHLRTLPTDRRMVRVKEAKRVYGARGERLDTFLFDQALNATLVQGKWYTGEDSRRYRTWWEIDADNDYLERPSVDDLPGGRT